MAEKDYYKVLGVEKGASKDDIRAAYKRLAKQYHPDLNKEPGSSERFKEINEAASVLGDDEKRRQYDQFGSDAFKFSGAGGGQGRGGYDFSGFDFSNFGDSFDFDSIFDSFFGGPGAGGARSRGRRSGRGNDLAYELILSFEEAALGVKKKIRVTKNGVCGECDGHGGHGEENCSYCNGAGMIRESRRTPFGIFQTSVACRHCAGTGVSFKRVCSACSGSGRVRDSKTIEVSVPGGVVEGARLRVNGEGEAGFRGGQPGDLYIIIHVEEDERFDREGDDIIVGVSVSFVQAALGGKVKVPSLEGDVPLKVPAGSQPGDVLKIKGAGVKRMHGFGRGDLLVQLQVEIPRNLSRKQEKLLREFEAGAE